MPVEIPNDKPPEMTKTARFWARSRYVILPLLAVYFLSFGGYLLAICGTLCALFWTLFYRRFGFASRKAAVRSGLLTFGLFYGLSGFFLLLGSYLETMAVIGMSLR